MLSFIIIFYFAVIYTAVMVWNHPTEIDNFVDLVKDVIMLAVGGYWGRIAITHYQTLKKGKDVKKDIPDPISEDDLEDSNKPL